LVRPRADPTISQYRRVSGLSGNANDSVPPLLGSSW
jgi:hypothetical protein